MAVKLSANIQLQNLWHELTHRADRGKIVQQTVNPSSPMLKASPRPTRTIRLPNDLMIMNCQRLDWTLSLVERLTAVPCLSCYGTEPNFFIQHLSLCSRFIVDFSFCSKKKQRRDVVY